MPSRVPPRGPGSPLTARELLDLFFLDVRCALLETAATLDRIDRAPHAAAVAGDPRLEKIAEACRLLQDGRGDRAERFLVLFSDGGTG